MFLDNLLKQQNLPSMYVGVLKLLIAQLNLLLCLVNDILDIKLIQVGKYELKQTKFRPQEALNFIVDMFKPQSDMQCT